MGEGASTWEPVQGAVLADLRRDAIDDPADSLACALAYRLRHSSRLGGSLRLWCLTPTYLWRYGPASSSRGSLLRRRGVRVRSE